MKLSTQLQKIGLTGREAEIYLALLQKKEINSPEIAKITTVSRTKVYEILQNLINKGLCTEKNKDGKKLYSAIDPKIAIENVLSNYEQELSRRKEIAAELEKELSELYKLNSNKFDPLEYIEILHDLGQIKERWIALQKNVNKEILVFNKAPYAVAQSDNVPIEQQLLKNKVKARAIYEYNDLLYTESEFAEILPSLVSAGEEARIIKSLPMKLAIIDEKVTMLALNDPITLKPSITTIIITHPSFAKAQKEVFEKYWEEAISFEEFQKRMKI